MNTKNNQRYNATQEAIESAFIKLLAIKEPEKITVADICRDVGINRSSFYLHFQDVYDLMTKIETAMSQRMVDVFLSHKMRTITDGFTRLFEYIKDNADFYAAYLCKSNNAAIIKVLLPSSLEKSMRSFIAELGYKGEEEFYYHEQFFKAGITGFIRMWLSRGCTETPEEMSGIIYRQYNQRTHLFSWDDR